MKTTLKYIKLLLLVFCIGGAVSACKDDDDEEEVRQPELTIFMHQPKSGLEYALSRDLEEVNRALLANLELEKKINVLYFRSDTKTGSLYKKPLAKDAKSGENYIKDVLLKEYSLESINYTTENGLQQILSDVISIGQTERMIMVLGCHGTGWLPTYEDKSQKIKQKFKVYGTNIDKKYDTTFQTLGNAIEATGKQFEAIVMDICLSQNIEVAYDLRNSCHYLIGSITEVGKNGLPYEDVIPNLYTKNFSAVCDKAIEYYQKPDNTWKTATFSVIDCNEVEPMADIIKQINCAETNTVDRSTIQTFDGLDCTKEYGFNVLYDFSDYIHHYCGNKELLTKFDNQMKKLVVYNAFTPNFNADCFQNYYLRPIKTCCGVTSSALCTEMQKEWQETNWYKRTAGK